MEGEVVGCLFIFCLVGMFDELGQEWLGLMV